MPLLVYNITGTPVTLAAGSPPAPTIPASASPPGRGEGVNVTSELRPNLTVDPANGVSGGLAAADYTALEAQRPGTLEYEWTSDPEYAVGTLTVGGPAGGAHASNHATGGSDPLTVDNQTATNQSASTGVSVNTTTATNQSSTTGATVDNQTATNNSTTTGATVDSQTATNQSATTGVAVDNATATNNSTTTGATVDSQTATNQSSTTGATVDATTATNIVFKLAVHETFINPDAPSTAYGTIAESAGTASASLQPSHPRVLQVVFAAGWDGGAVTVTGLAPDGSAAMEAFPSTPGGTVIGSVAFATIAPSGIANDSPAGAADLATVEAHGALGMANSPVASFEKVSVDGVDETVGTSSLTEGTMDPTTPADGVKDFEVWYTIDIAITQASHSHGLTDPGHNHTQDAHSHGLTDLGHNHTQNAHNHTVTDTGHNHTQDAHSHGLTDLGHNHTQNMHTHGLTDPGHNHTQDVHGHTITDPTHTHTQDAHDHNVSG